MKYLITFFLIIIGLAAYSQGQWTTLGTEGLFTTQSYHSLATNNNGQVFIAYKDNTNNGKTSVMTFTGGAWQFIGTSGFGNSGDFQNLFISNNGQLYVAYRDAQNDNKVSAMTFTGGTWQFIGTSGFGDTNNGLQNIAVNSSGIVYVGYQKNFIDNMGIANRNEEVMIFSGGSWINFSNRVTGTSFGGLRYTAMMPNGSFGVSQSSMAIRSFRNGSTLLGSSSNLVGNEVLAFTKSGDFFRLNNGNIEKISNGSITNLGNLPGFDSAIAYKHLGVRNNGEVFVIYQNTNGTIQGNFMIYDPKCFGYTSFMQAPSGVANICYKKPAPQIINDNQIISIPMTYQNTTDNTINNGKINFLGEYPIPSTNAYNTGVVEIQVKVFNASGFKKHVGR